MSLVRLTAMRLRMALVILPLTWFLVSCDRREGQAPSPSTNQIADFRPTNRPAAPAPAPAEPKPWVLQGQVFVTLPNRETIKLSLTDIRFAKLEQARSFAELVR